jgi:hypothetical protein
MQLINKIIVVVFIAFLVSCQDNAQDFRWKRGGPDSGLIKALAIDPMSPLTIYAGT